MCSVSDLMFSGIPNLSNPRNMYFRSRFMQPHPLLLDFLMR